MRIITREQDVRVSMLKQKVNVQSTVIAKWIQSSKVWTKYRSTNKGATKVRNDLKNTTGKVTDYPPTSPHLQPLLSILHHQPSSSPSGRNSSVVLSIYKLHPEAFFVRWSLAHRENILSLIRCHFELLGSSHNVAPPLIPFAVKIHPMCRQRWPWGQNQVDHRSLSYSPYNTHTDVPRFGVIHPLISLMVVPLVGKMSDNSAYTLCCLGW